MTTTSAVNLNDFDLISVSTSGGKDSADLLATIVSLADQQGFPRERIVAVHADLGRMEWAGTKDVARAQCEQYGIRLEVVKRPQGDLLDHVRTRHQTLVAQGKPEAPAWFSSAARYCTSDHKRSQIFKVWTALVREVKAAKGKTHRVRILDCQGLRAEESPARANCNKCKGKGETKAGVCETCKGSGERQAYTFRADASNGQREVWTWLPILHHTTDEVWAVIRASGLPSHYAYDLGMPRLSCVFCIFAPKAGLLLSGYHNRELLDEYVAVEDEVGASFKMDLSLRQVRDELDAGWAPQGSVSADSWEEGKGKAKARKAITV